MLLRNVYQRLHPRKAGEGLRPTGSAVMLTWYGTGRLLRESGGGWQPAPGTFTNERYRPGSGFGCFPSSLGIPPCGGSSNRAFGLSRLSSFRAPGEPDSSRSHAGRQPPFSRCQPSLFEEQDKSANRTFRLYEFVLRTLTMTAADCPDRDRRESGLHSTIETIRGMRNDLHSQDSSPQSKRAEYLFLKRLRNPVSIPAPGAVGPHGRQPTEAAGRNHDPSRRPGRGGRAGRRLGPRSRFPLHLKSQLHRVARTVRVSDTYGGAGSRD